MTEETINYVRMQFLVSDPEDVAAPGVQLKAYNNVVAVPRELEVIRVNGQKYQVRELGVLWNFVPNGVNITVTLYKVPE